MKKRFSGTVIWYDADNAHGIIRLHASRKTVSIHGSQIHHDAADRIHPLHVGQDVSFEVVDTQARNLYLL